MVPFLVHLPVSAATIRRKQTMIMAHRISAMQGAVNAMIPYLLEWSEQGIIPEVEWSKLRKLDFREALRARDGYVSKIAQQSHILGKEDFAKDYATVDKRKRLQREIASLRMSISDQNLELLPDYEQRIQVLKTLRFVDPLNESVLLKGRVACEINSVNELVLTDLNNVFAAYQPDEIVALLSVFVFQEKTEVVPELSVLSGLCHHVGDCGASGSDRGGEYGHSARLLELAQAWTCRSRVRVGSRH
ncbi:unnamed protein product, partial [Tilletia caries]